jgi:phosphoribosylformimino-5-aminoimidazole carboxamide ribonucleotide (ProFAR) isomerase
MPLTCGVIDHVSSHAGIGLGQLGDVANHDIINGLSSQIMLQSDDSLQIGASGGVESIQDIKAVHVVVATSIFGHRSLLRRTLLRRADGGLR